MLVAARHWFLLAFMAGSVNAGGFLASGRFVSHVTGFAAHFGIDIGQGHILMGLSMLFVPCFFFLGSFLTGLLVHVPRVLGRAPNESLVYLIMTLCFGLVWFGGIYGFFGQFFETLQLGADSILIILLCMGCGLQNALDAPGRGPVIRTTHLTGVTSDLAVGLAHALSGASRLTNRELRARNTTRMGIIFSYILGSLVGAFLFLRYEYQGFLLPTIMSAGFAMFSFRSDRGSRVSSPQIDHN